VQLEHTFTVPVGVDEAWQVLTDIERVAPCMPGATLESVDGDEFTGSVKVRLGPIGLTYKGKASFLEKDEVAHRAVIDARGKDARGNGTATAKVAATLTEQGGQTAVHVDTELNITGKPAQFGRGVMVDVGNKLIGQFADCLADRLSGGAAPAAESAESADQASTITVAAAPPSPLQSVPASDESAPTPVRSAPSPVRPAAEPIDLLASAGPAIARRLLPVGVALVVLLIVVQLRRRRSR
jgi:carbon monoxide dehydrogenase subunit G